MSTLPQIQARFLNVRAEMADSHVLSDTLIAILNGLDWNLCEAQRGQTPALIRAAFCLGKLSALLQQMVETQYGIDRENARVWGKLVKGALDDIQRAAFASTVGV